MSTELEKPDQPVISLFFFGGVFAIVLHIFLYLKMKRVMSFIWKALHKKSYFFRLYMIRYDARECKIFFCESPSQSPFLFLFLRSLDCVNRTEAGSNRQRQNKCSHTSSWELRTGKCEKLSKFLVKSEREVFKFG